MKRAALEELNDLRKLHGIHYVDENPLLTFMRVNDEGKSTLEHILKEEITQEPVNQYSIFSQRTRVTYLRASLDKESVNFCIL